jgi:hypothetical protein
MNSVQIISSFIKSKTEKQQISWPQPQFSNDHRPAALSFGLSAGAARPPRTPPMKHLTNAASGPLGPTPTPRWEVGLRPVGAIGACAPEGMWNAEGWSRCALSL